MRTILKRTCQLILALVLVTSAFAEVPPATASAEEPDAVSAAASHVNLRYGSRGWQVAQLQQNLRALGYFHYKRNTGFYGWITTGSVKRFQGDYNLRQDGVAGPVTRSAVHRAVLKRKLIADSTRYIGIKYVWGAESPRQGFDCSGFIHYMFKRHGVNMPRTTAAQMYRKGAPVSRKNLRPGDLVFFSMESRGAISHVGFYMGHNKFISATMTKGVWIYRMDNSYWAPHYMGAKRVY